MCVCVYVREKLIFLFIPCLLFKCEINPLSSFKIINPVLITETQQQNPVYAQLSMLYWSIEYSCSQGEAKSVLQMVSPNTGNISNLMLTSQYITKQLSDKPRGEERKTSLRKILLLPFSEQEIKPDSKRQ